jgi:hypothetical protein
VSPWLRSLSHLAYVRDISSTMFPHASRMNLRRLNAPKGNASSTARPRAFDWFEAEHIRIEVVGLFEVPDNNGDMVERLYGQVSSLDFFKLAGNTGFLLTGRLGLAVSRGVVNGVILGTPCRMVSPK